MREHAKLVAAQGEVRTCFSSLPPLFFAFQAMLRCHCAAINVLNCIILIRVCIRPLQQGLPSCTLVDCTDSLLPSPGRFICSKLSCVFTGL